MEQLRYLSLVSKVCQELENHYNIKEKVIAEYVIDLANKTATVKEFTQKLKGSYGGFDDTFSENIYNIIQFMQPRKESLSVPVNIETEKKNVDDMSIDERKNLFPSLVLPNKSIPLLDKIYTTTKNEEIKSSKKSLPRDLPDIYYNENEEKKPKPKPVIEAKGRLMINETYEALVSGVQVYGFFARLVRDSRGVPFYDASLPRSTNCEGLCHISEVREGNERIGSVSDFVARGEKVFVKVIQVVGKRISLSFKEVDQRTGRDLFARQKRFPNSSDFKPMENSGRNVGGAIVSTYDNNNNNKREERRPRQKLTEYDLFDIMQMAKSGVVPKHLLPTFDEEYGVLPPKELEMDFDIERNDAEPPFLKGQTDRGSGTEGIVFEPKPIIRAPSGSMQRMARESAERARERKEIRENQRRKLERESRGKVKKWELHEDMPEWRKSVMSGSYGKITNKSISQQRKSLPIYRYRNEILKAVKNNEMIIIIGETGSGKTTQIPQYLAEVGYTGGGLIGVTQPRRVAAVSVAKRVAEEVGCECGDDVGYTIRFEDCTSRNTKLKYMTDGMLLRESLIDPSLSKYSVIMLDEAHERQLHTDVLFGLCKKLVTQGNKKRKTPLKLIVTSATLDAKKFSSFFNKCPVFSIPGRTFPVDTLYAKEPETDYLEASLMTVMQIHLTEPPGDILLFLTGQEEIDTSCEILFDRMKSLGSDIPELIILPIYSALPGEIQSRIFEQTPEGSRKVVIATNIAETSITISGIYYVVDPGFVKQNYFNPKTGMEQLMVVPISQAQAMQRSGRAGRVGPGKCFRLYTEDAFHNELLPVSVPEIQRTNLGNTVLLLKAMGINNLLEFHFMDPPSTTQLINAMEQLYQLEALDEEGLLTKMGRKMAEFPLEPQMSKALIKSEEFGCTDEVLTIVSMLSTPNIFYRPREKKELADKKKLKFHQNEGDHLTLLAVYKAWQQHNFSNQWCYDNFIQARSLKKAHEIRKQLLGVIDRSGVELRSSGRNYTAVRKAICSGFFAQAAKRDSKSGYRTLVDDQPVYVHPSSSLFNKNPEWVIYHKMIITSREYMRECMTIDPKWLTVLAPHFYKKVNPKKLSKRKRSEKIEPLFDRRLQDQDDWRMSRRRKYR